MIEYHEDTGSFTFTDPWIELENEQSIQTSNDTSDYESTVDNSCYFEEEVVQVSNIENDETTLTIPDQNQNHTTDNVNNKNEDFHETTQHNNNMIHEESYEQLENVVENHIEDSEPKPDEVSFQNPEEKSKNSSLVSERMTFSGKGTVKFRIFKC